MKRMMSISLALILALSSVSMMPVRAFAEGGDAPAVIAAPGTGTIPDSYTANMDEAEKILAQAIYTGYSNMAPGLKDKVVEFVRPQLAEIGKQVYTTMQANKSTFDAITYKKPPLDMITSQIPSGIPAGMIPAEIKTRVRSEIIDGIRSSFATIPDMVDTAVRINLDKISPTIITQVKPQVKVIVFSVGDLIDETITGSIDAEISKVLPQVMDLLPDDMDGLTPEQIAEKYRTKMEPAAQAALRPSMESEIKEVINAQVEELVEKPIGELMDPKIDQIDDASIYAIIDMIPSSVNGIITNDEIKAVVAEEMVKLNIRDQNEVAQAIMKYYEAKQVTKPLLQILKERKSSQKK